MDFVDIVQFGCAEHAPSTASVLKELVSAAEAATAAAVAQVEMEATHLLYGVVDPYGKLHSLVAVEIVPPSSGYSQQGVCVSSVVQKHLNITDHNKPNTQSEYAQY